MELIKLDDYKNRYYIIVIVLYYIIKMIKNNLGITKNSSMAKTQLN